MTARRRLSPMAWIFSGCLHAAVLVGGMAWLSMIPNRAQLEADPWVMRMSVMPPPRFEAVAAIPPSPRITIEAQELADPLIIESKPPLVPVVPVEEEPTVAQVVPGLTSAADQDLPSLAVGVHRLHPPAQGNQDPQGVPADHRDVAPQPAATGMSVASPSVAMAPVPTVRVSPDYPASARRQGLEGDVILIIDITADGTPSAVAVETSSGHQVLDVCALAAAKRWRFTPQAGAPGRTRITIRFRLT